MKERMAYYNTNRERGTTLENSESQARRQEDSIMQLFSQFPSSLLSPEEVHRSFPESVPLTSIRRAITNLSQLGKLEKTSNMTTGKYGKRVHLWRLSQVQK
jgi:hypothetical protein